MMHNGKFQNSAPKRRSTRKPIVILVSLIMMVVLATGATVAYLQDSAGSVVNTFSSAEVKVDIEEAWTGTEKSNIKFKNTGTDVPVYVRATLAIYWTDTIDGQEVSVPQPADAKVEGGTKLGTNWFQVGDIYYYSLPVTPGNSTEVMLDTIKVTVPEGSTAKCHIDVHYEAIQAAPTTAVEDAWQDVNVDTTTGALTKAGGAA